MKPVIPSSHQSTSPTSTSSSQQRKLQKPQYQRSNAKNWCKYCRIYVYNNETSMRAHEISPRHKEALRISVKQLQRKEEQTDLILRDIQSKTGISLSNGQVNTKPIKNGNVAAASFYGAAAEETKIGKNQRTEEKVQHLNPHKYISPLLAENKSESVSSNTVTNPAQTFNPRSWDTPQQRITPKVPELTQEPKVTDTITLDEKKSTLDSSLKSPIRIELRKFNKPTGLNKK